MEDFGLYDLLFILKKRWKIIVILPIILVLIFGLVSFYVLDPIYQSSTTIMVGEGKLAHTYVSLIEGKDFYGEVVENLNLDIGFGDFKENVEVSLVRDPEIIKIDVTDTNPELAANIANEMARVFIEKTEDFMEKKIQIVDGVEIEEEPTAPKLINEAYIAKNPVSPNPMLNMVIAGVVGIILGVFMA